MTVGGHYRPGRQCGQQRIAARQLIQEFSLESSFLDPLILSTMRMNLRMKKCWMKKDEPGWSWRCVSFSSLLKMKCGFCLCVYSNAGCSLSQVENTIRWRAKRDEEGNETRESNARIVKWSDGRCVCVSVWHPNVYTVKKDKSCGGFFLNMHFFS